MLHSVLHVVGLRTPSDITGGVIRGIPVGVQGHGPRERHSPVKGFADQDVDANPTPFTPDTVQEARNVPPRPRFLDRSYPNITDGGGSPAFVQAPQAAVIPDSV